jgi:hypothetical protein
MENTQAAQSLASDLKQQECYARAIRNDMVAFCDPVTLNHRACPYDLATLLMACDLGLVERRTILKTTDGGYSEIIDLYAPFHSSR